ncbi:beta strand repeat-containing protein, partial [uncultured Tenacibaculum sp.]|uniref:beta strand repeat-containing protein n=1 Tax=uncultured Tenacibaculum sp. TaxID=174713 RepID=UPI003592E90B
MLKCLQVIFLRLYDIFLKKIKAKLSVEILEFSRKLTASQFRKNYSKSNGFAKVLHSISYTFNRTKKKEYIGSLLFGNKLKYLGVLILSLTVTINVNSQCANPTDCDNDGILNLSDLDDDNDGILDTDEGCPAPTTISFTNVSAIPATAFVSGGGTIPDGSEGLRISDITGNYSIDIYQGAATVSSGDPVTFNTTTGLISNNDPILDNEYVELIWTTSNSATSFNIPRLFINDINSLTAPANNTDVRDSYAWSEDGVWTIDTDPLSGNPGGAIVSFDDAAADDVGSFIVNDKDGGNDINFIGNFNSLAALDTTPSNVLLNMTGDPNGHSAQFDFNTPQTTVSLYLFDSRNIGSAVAMLWNFFPQGSVTIESAGLDSDGDGVDNCVDLDTDNDGIYDVLEAGHGIAHTNGVILGAVGADGIPDAVQAAGQEDSGTINYTLANSEPTPDTLFDFQDTDSDDDGCSDANEAYNDSNADGGDGGSFGTGEPQTNVDSATGLVTFVGVDYTVGTNSNVTDDTVSTGCVVNPDTDGDGNPDTTDSNPSTPTAVNDSASATAGILETISILANDDFTDNTNGNSDPDNINPISVTTLSTVVGINTTAAGLISYDAGTGELNYTPLLSEGGTVVTIEYQVCNDVNGDSPGTTTDDVCDTAIVTINIAFGDSDGDGVVDGSDICPGGDDALDADSDGVPDGCDQDDDNDGILDTDEFDCPTSGLVALGQTFTQASTGTTSGSSASGTVNNVYNHAGVTGTFSFEVINGATWAGGVSSTSNGGITGDYVNVQPNNTNFPVGTSYPADAGSISVAVYTFTFDEPIQISDFKWGGLDFQDRADFSASLSGSNVALTVSDINLGTSFIRANSPQSVISSATGSNAPNNSVSISSLDPIDTLVIVAGKANGSGGNVTMQFYEFSYCFSQDFDGDTVPNSLDLDSDNDGIYDVVEADGADVNNDGIADGVPNTSTGIPSSASTGLTVPNTDGDTDGGNPYDLDSDNDGCSDSNEYYNDTNADGGGGQYGNGTTDPAPSNANGTVIAASYPATAADTDTNSTADYVEGTAGTPLPNTDGDSLANACDLDDDNDGNPDTTDTTNPNTPTAVDDSTSATAGVLQTVQILANDDFTDNTDGNGDPDNINPASITTINTVVGVNTTAGGTITYDADTGELNYLPLSSEGGTTVTIEYQVCNDITGDGATGDDVCSTAIVTITVAIGDADGDGVLDNLDICAGGDDSADADSDGVPDFCDEDDDNDGILDVDECVINFISIRPFEDLGILDNTTNNTITDVDISARLGLAPGSVLISATGLNRPDTNPNLFVGDTFSGTPSTFTISGTAASRVRARLEHGGVIQAGSATDVVESLDGTLYDFTTTLTGDFNDISNPLKYEIQNITTTNANNGSRFTWESTKAGVTNFSFSSNDTGDDSAIFLSLSVDPDFDGDGLADCIDLDSDNDGIYDVVEANGTDINNDGFADGIPNTSTGIPSSAGTGLTVPNTDGTDRGNPYDLDSDDDGCSDSNEYYDDSNADGGGGQYGNGTTDPAPVNLNGTVIAASYPATAADTDTNTVADYIEGTAGTPLPDLDGDSLTNACDLDDDGDGNPDTTDPNPTTTTVANDTATVASGTPVTTNVLTNDDYVGDTDPAKQAGTT